MVRKILSLFFVFCILFQSCEVYKPASVPALKAEKNYRLTLSTGHVMETKIKMVNEENLIVAVNGSTVEIPKSGITKVERIKPSLTKWTVGIILATVAIAVIAKNADKETPQERNEKIN